MWWWSVELWGYRFILQDNDTVSSHSNCLTISNGRKVGPAHSSGERWFHIRKLGLLRGPRHTPPFIVRAVTWAGKAWAGFTAYLAQGAGGRSGQWADCPADSRLGAQLPQMCGPWGAGRLPPRPGSQALGSGSGAPLTLLKKTGGSEGTNRDSCDKVGTMWMTSERSVQLHWVIWVLWVMN